MATALPDTLRHGGSIQEGFRGGNLSTVNLGMPADGERYASYPFPHTFGRQDATVPDVEIGKLHSCWCDV